MEDEIPDSELAMTLLNRLPEDINSSISALDAVHIDETNFRWEHFKSRVLQEEQRINTCQALPLQSRRVQFYYPMTTLVLKGVTLEEEIDSVVIFAVKWVILKTNVGRSIHI